MTNRTGFTADIVAHRVAKQCDLILPSDADGWRRVIRRRRIAKRSTTNYSSEWYSGSKGSGLSRWFDRGGYDRPPHGWRVRLLIGPAPEGGVEARLFVRDQPTRALALVDGRLSEADAEAIRERFETELLAATLA